MDAALIGLAKVIFVVIIIGISYVVLLIISKFTKGKIKVDSYAALNGFLYFGLIFNLVNFGYTLLDSNARESDVIFSSITPLVIILILVFRYIKTKRII